MTPDNRRFGPLLGVLILATVVVGACGSTSSAANAPVLIGFANIVRNGCEFCDNVEADMKKVFVAPKYQLFAVDNNVDANQILANDDAMIAHHVKVFLEFDGGITNYQTTISKMAAAHIPTIFIDGPIPPKAPNVYWMGANSGEAGSVLGQYAVNYVQTNWNNQIDGIFGVWQSTWPPETKLRLINAVAQITADLPQWTMSTITVSSAVLSPEVTQAAATAFLNAHPGQHHLLFITCTNDIAGVASESAMKTLGRSTDGVILSMGADSSAQKAIRGGPPFIMSVAYFPDKYGTLAQPIVDAILAGNTPPDVTYQHHLPIDASNINQYYPAT